METAVVPRTAEYALRAAAVLAAHDQRELLPVRVISEASGVPEAYLAKVLRRLEEAGIVEAARGRKGGFRLARAPQDVRFADVLEAVDVEAGSTHCAFGWARCNASDPCPLHHAFASLRGALLTWAAEHRLSDVDASQLARFLTR